MSSTRELAGRLRPERKIDAVSAVLLPFTADGEMDLAFFRSHLLRTRDAGLRPAVNMDTGFGPELNPGQRQRILDITREVLGPKDGFVAGAMPFGESGDMIAAYRRSVQAIVEAGGTPIIFPSGLLAECESGEVERVYREVTAGAPAALGFELGRQFAAFGRIFDADTFRRLMAIPNLVGIKHSSLDRGIELERLEIRDRERTGFRIYTGNDLGIDMIMYGSDYLLGLSTFEPEAFALRDRWWEEGDARFYELNDALQALGAVAFRDPVPAYKDSAVAYLRKKGWLKDGAAHPACPRRPGWESEILAPLADRIASIVNR